MLNKNTDPNMLYQQAVQLHQSGHLDKALEIYQILNKRYPNNFRMLYILGTAEAERGNYQKSASYFNESIALNAMIPESYNNLGFVLKELKRFDEALQSVESALQLRPDYPEAHNNKGTILEQLKRFDEALQSYDFAVRMKPGFPEAHYNRGNILKDLKRFHEALQSYNTAIDSKPEYAEAFYNRGIVLHELRQPEEALLSYNRAIQLQINCPEIYNDLGLVYAELMKYDEALQCYEHLIENRPDNSEVHFNKGMASLSLKNMDIALHCFSTALQLNNNNKIILGYIVNTKLCCCDWENLTDYNVELQNDIMSNEYSIDPLTTLLLLDSLDIQQQSAMSYVNNRCFSGKSPTDRPTYPRHDKIRLGYFSADFRDHPIMHLMSEMFEKHDRSRFELYGFSFGPVTDDPLRKRAQQCFDRFFDVRCMADQDVVTLAQSLQIDIAVDLMGFTEGSRTNLFAGRAAPVQVNYLGYPGTMGAEFIDYIIADETVIPESDRHYFTEKVVYLPDSFQVNCRTREASPRLLTREELYLPQHGFVFCCFNNNNKITPAMFDSWMRILLQVEESVLWLFESNARAADNLRMEAQKRGISADRLVFAKRLPRIEDHLNRIRHADLFLDTLPYNAHTTASDALRMGVPLVTRTGNAFAGRVAASLLKTLDLHELITQSAEEYEKLAVKLASERDYLQRIREKLHVNVRTSPLFDSLLFTRNMEKAYERMYEQNQNSRAPEHMIIAN